MKKLAALFLLAVLTWACSREEQSFVWDNPEFPLNVPQGFPSLNEAVSDNKPTRYGVALGEKLFHEKKLSGNNTISCASCHNPSNAFADNQVQAIGVHGRVGLRNTPPIQNLAFMRVYNWDGSMLQLEKQPLVPIITHEEMDSSVLAIIAKLQKDATYPALFRQAFGNDEITPERIYRSLAQYQYTLISANSKYDHVTRLGVEEFTDSEARGYGVFQAKCETCHESELFTDQSFRNIGFPVNPSSQEAGRARVTGLADDYMRFRVPSLRNVAYTAPYGSFGQFPTLRSLLDYLDSGVIDAENLDPVLRKNGNRIQLSEQEKDDLIAFLQTLSDPEFTGRTE